MVDHKKLVKQFLDAQTSVTSLLGNIGVHAGDLPQKFDPLNSPETSPCVTIARDGGTSFENAPIKTARMRVKVWAGRDEQLKASNVYAAIFDALDGQTSVQLADGFIITAYEDVAGQDLTDPEEGWATVLSYWSVMARE